MPAVGHLFRGMAIILDCGGQAVARQINCPGPYPVALSESQPRQRSGRRLNLGLLQKDINVAWDLAPHDISIILYVLGKVPVSVNCQGKSHVARGVEDVTNMTLNFANGAFGIIQSSWLDPNKVRETVFIGKKKMLVYNDVEPIEKIRIYDKRVEIPPHYDSFGEFQYSYHYGGVYSPYAKLVEPLRVECQHFIDCIRTGAKSESSGKDGLEVVRILEAASASLKNGGAQVAINQYPKIASKAV